MSQILRKRKLQHDQILNDGSNNSPEIARRDQNLHSSDDGQDLNEKSPDFLRFKGEDAPRSNSRSDQDEIIFHDSNELSKRSTGTSDSVAMTNFEVVTEKNLHTVDEMCYIVSVVGFSIWILLCSAVYYITPTENFVPLSDFERQASKLAGVLLIVSMATKIIPILVSGEKPTKSGIMCGAFTVQAIATVTDFIFAYKAVPIRIDPITNRKVYLLRWAEWTPLAAMMTIFTELVDYEHALKFKSHDKISSRLSSLSFDKEATRTFHWRAMWSPIIHSILQGASSFQGLVFPHCSGVLSWSLCMAFSTLAFSSIGIRIITKRRNFKSLVRGTSASEIEHYECARWSLRILCTCVIMWSTLIFIYFFAWLAPLTPYAKNNHDSWINHPSLIFMLETFFEVCSKVIFLHAILHVHSIVFDSAARSARRLEELRTMMAVVWDTSSDVIAISARRPHTNTATTVLSSNFFKHACGIDARAKFPTNDSNKLLKMKSFVFEHQLSLTTDINQITNPKFLYCMDISTGNKYWTEDEHFGTLTKPGLFSMCDLMTKAWLAENAETLILHDLKKFKGDPIRCEAKAMKLERNALVVVMRDISERSLRFEAEKQVVSQTTARKKDSEANRFTRHEVKNGLLAAIGLCDGVKECLSDVSYKTSADQAPDSSHNRVSSRALLNGAQTKQGMYPFSSHLPRYVSELDFTLREVLETVLAEAMSRDLVHQIYEPRTEHVNIPSLLVHVQEGLCGCENSERFSFMSSPNPFPAFKLDPQLLKYIHRNAMSNACKYGKKGGEVATEIIYSSEKSELEINVINLPGNHHEYLSSIGKAATDEVFAPAKRLRCHIEDSGDGKKGWHSSGDGAWISRQCARTLGGDCTIEFQADRTVFKLRFPAKSLQENIDFSKFKLPEGTYGLAIDDSKIQQKLMNRFFCLAGIPESKQLILGKDENEIRNFEQIAVDFTNNHSENYVLLVADENLEVTNYTDNPTISGSLCVESIRDKLGGNTKRLLTLIRSANDSSDDISQYKKRAHGFLPKTPIKRQKTLDVLAPLWAERFPDTFALATPENIASQIAAENRFQSVTADLIQTMDVIDALCFQNETTLPQRWPILWQKLLVLKGDLMTMPQIADTSDIIKRIDILRGPNMPMNFVNSWHSIRQVVEKSISRDDTLISTKTLT